MLIMPKDAADVQSDGNFTSNSYNGAWVVRYGDYLILLNKSGSAYSAKLPNGIGWAEDLVSKSYYALGANNTVSVAAGTYAIFWLNAGSVIGGLGTAASGVDVGAVGIAGSDSYSGGAFTISGAGNNIGGTADAFHFVATPVSGDATLVAQIASQLASNPLAQSGVMVRDGTAGDAAFADVVRTPGGGLRFEYRTAAGTDAAWYAAPTPLAGVWVKLARSGNTVAGYYSTDGVSWTQLGPTITLALRPRLSLV